MIAPKAIWVRASLEASRGAASEAAALRRSLNLPEGAAFEIFAIARSVGWIALALEQRQAGGLIGLRAHDTGSRPETVPPGGVVRTR